MAQVPTAAPVDPAAPPAPAVPPEGRPWGFWATMGFSTVVVVVQIIIAAAVAVVFVIACPEAADKPKALANPFESNGLFMSAIFLASAPPCSALIVLLAWLRHKQYPLRKYLGLAKPRLWRLLGWTAASVALVAAGDVVSYLMGQPVVPQFMVDVYKTSYFPPLLFFTLIVVGPAFEELLVRGFMLEGIRRSRAGPVVALLVTSVLWAACHTQYSWHGIVAILVYGLLLGLARMKTNCLWTCFAMHAATNLLATVQVMVKVGVLD